jgi:hypothetical protein
MHNGARFTMALSLPIVFALSLPRYEAYTQSLTMLNTFLAIRHVIVN